MLELLAASIVGLAVYDAYFTKRRILKYGLAVELNPELIVAAQKLGLDFALFLRVIAPTLVLTLVGLRFQWALFLAFLAGVRATVWNFQRLSGKLERELDKRLGGNEAVPPSPSPNGGKLPPPPEEVLKRTPKDKP